MTDLEVYKEVRNEFLSGAGISLILRNVIKLTDALAQTFDDDFDIEKACEGLDNMQYWAATLKVALKKRKGE